MIEIIQNLNNFIDKINNKLGVHTKLIDPNSELMPFFSILSIIFCILLLILGIKFKNKILIGIAILATIVNILILLDRWVY